MYIGTPLTSERHRTLCRVGGQLCALSQENGDGTVLVEWLSDQPGASREAAMSIGLVPESGFGNVPVRADQVEGPFVHFSDVQGELWPAFPGPAMYGDLVRPAAQPDVTAGLKASLGECAADDWQEIRLDCQAMGTRLQVSGSVVRAGAESAWIPSADVVEWLRRLRFCSYTRENGAWTSAKVVFTGGETTVDTGYAEPVWQHDAREGVSEQIQSVYPPHVREMLFKDVDDGHLREYYEELKFFPRDRAAVPDWLLERAWEYHTRLTEKKRARETRSFDQYTHGVRTAQTFDGPGADGRPTVYRAALTLAEKEQVLGYLRRGHLVVSAYSRSEDVLDPQRPADVPNIWLTDGPWLWPAAMTYYLAEHNISPPHDFLDHIRAASYEPPEVLPEAARDRAQNALMGGDSQAGLPYQAEAHEIIGMTKRMIAGLRITKRSYSFEAAVEGAWCMLMEPDGWWTVFLQTDGARKEEVRFHQTMDAAAHLVGCLSMTQDVHRRPADEPLDDYECLQQPLPGETPLSEYDGKQHVEIQAGSEVDRIGDTEGNTVFVAGTALVHRGMTPDQPTTPYHRYRVEKPFECLVGYLRPKPEYGLPGGGQAYVLPQSVSELVAGGWLGEL